MSIVCEAVDHFTMYSLATTLARTADRTLVLVAWLESFQEWLGWLDKEPICDQVLVRPATGGSFHFFLCELPNNLQSTALLRQDREVLRCPRRVRLRCHSGQFKEKIRGHEKQRLRVRPRNSAI